MQNTIITEDEGDNRGLPESIELIDVTPSGSAENSPSSHQTQIESPGAIRHQKPSDEIDKMLDLFEKTVGYMPLFTEVNGNRNIQLTNAVNRAEVLGIIQRGISYANIEKRVNLVVMVVILLDTGLVAFEFENDDLSQPEWITIMNWVFLMVYVLEVGFRLQISTPTSSFLRKRFYVLDLLIVVMCLVLQIASTMSTIASAIRAIRLLRTIRIGKLIKFLRIFTRVLELWHACNKRKIKDWEGTSLDMHLRLKVGNSKLQALLAKKKLLSSVNLSGRSSLDELDIQELFKIVKVLKEQEDRLLFSWTEFSMEWLTILIIWLGICLSLSAVFKRLEWDNYEMIIEENIKLKSILDNSLPVRDQVPDVLTTLAGCPGDATNETYASLHKIYHEYSNANRTL